MPSSAMLGELVLPGTAAAPDPDPGTHAPGGDLASAKCEIVADLRQDRRTLRAFYIAQLSLVFSLAIVFAAVATAGLVISVGRLRAGFDPADLKDVVAVLATGSTSLFGGVTVRLLKRFNVLGKSWMAEERKLTRARNLVRMGEDKDTIRAALADYFASRNPQSAERENDNDVAPGSPPRPASNPPVASGN
jgi:hypothetical protein